MVSNSPRADKDVSSEQDDTLDTLDDTIDTLDSSKGERAPLRRRRAHSRPRLRRAHSKDNRALRDAEASVRAVAEAVARKVCGHKEENLDIACKVAGVTHRGGFKLRVMHIEEINSAMVDRWRAVCLSRGYASTISFDVTASEAIILASPLVDSAWPRAASRCGSAACGKMDPLNAIFLGAVALNTLRHALMHFS